MRRLTRAEYLRACATAGVVAPAFLFRPYGSSSRYRAYQFQRIKKLIHHAYQRTVFYRRRYDEAGVSPRDFRDLSDLPRFPTTTKEELVAAIRAGEMGGGSQRRRGIESVSSGSSGRVITVTHDVSDIHAYAAGRYRILDMTGRFRPWDRTLYIYTSEFPARSFFGLYPSWFVSTLNDLADTIRRIQEIRPSMLCVYPSRLVEIAARLDAADARALELKLISVNSETSSKTQRAALANHFGCPVLDEYSTEELGWTAAECAFGETHVWEDMAHLEILERDRDRPVTAGEQGEIVGTNLHNFATPFIRYRQGDLGSLHKSSCRCGRTFRALRDLVGRSNDAFHFDSGTVSPAYLLDSVYALLLNQRFPIADFCLLQESRNGVAFQYSVPERETAAPDLGSRIEQGLAALLPSGVAVRAELTAQMHKTASGKRNPIVSLVADRAREAIRV
jgi:phenylacetate-CoA ligase